MSEAGSQVALADESQTLAGHARADGRTEEARHNGYTSARHATVAFIDARGGIYPMVEPRREMLDGVDFGCDVSKSMKAMFLSSQVAHG